MLEIKTEETEGTPENTSTTEEAKPEEEKTSKPEEVEEKDAKPDEEEEENVSKPEEEQISQLEAENISPPEEEKIATPPPPPTAAAEEEENKEEEEVPQPLSPPPPPPSQPEQPQSTQINDVKEDITALNPLNNNEPEAHSETENKGKNRRYWTPKEEDRFFQIWGRENWRLTKHGKNTIFFAKWSEEMKERFNIDVKPEEVQCKVNQTRAKYRQVKRLLETDRTAIKWKKFDLVEKILKNQYRSKDDEPVPQEALENNRDLSPTELLNSSGNAPPSPTNCAPNAEQAINLNQTTVDFQLTDDISLSDHNLTSNVFSNNSQSSTSFSTELFGIDQMEIKQEIETDIKREGFSEFLPIGPNEDGAAAAGTTAIDDQISGIAASQSLELSSNFTSAVPSEIPNNINQNASAAAVLNNNNNRTIPFVQNQNHMPLAVVTANNNNNVDGTIALLNHTGNSSNHATTMEPPRRPSVTATTTPRKRNRTTSGTGTAGAMVGASSTTQDVLESMYLEEIKKKNVILVEQGEINRKRLRLEERKVKLMEEFFPKYLTLQQDILKKLDNITNSTAEAINIRIEE